MEVMCGIEIMLCLGAKCVNSGSSSWEFSCHGFMGKWMRGKERNSS